MKWRRRDCVFPISCAGSVLGASLRVMSLTDSSWTTFSHSAFLALLRRPAQQEWQVQSDSPLALRLRDACHRGHLSKARWQVVLCFVPKSCLSETRLDLMFGVLLDKQAPLHWATLPRVRASGTAGSIASLDHSAPQLTVTPVVQLASWAPSGCNVVASAGS